MRKVLLQHNERAQIWAMIKWHNLYFEEKLLIKKEKRGDILLTYFLDFHIDVN